jgi:hypothetical protein
MIAMLARTPFALLLVVSIAFSFVLAFAFADVAACARSVAGLKLSTAKEDDFFTFFRFKEVERHETSKDKTLVMFETGTAGFGVQLAIVLSTKDEKVKAMTMVLPRKFVDDEKNGIFARDLAKSFLLAGVPEADAATIKTLVQEIQFGGQAKWTETKVGQAKYERTGEVAKDVRLTKPGTGELKKGDVAWLGAGPIPQLPDKPTPGYLAFLGKEPTYEKKLSNCRIRITNAETDGKQYVMFNVWVPGEE